MARKMSQHAQIAYQAVKTPMRQAIEWLKLEVLTPREMYFAYRFVLLAPLRS